MHRGGTVSGRVRGTTVRGAASLAAIVTSLVLLGSVLVGVAPAGAANVSTGEGAVADETGAKGGTASGLRTANAIELPDFAITPCPELSDSIVRLYSAYFLRAPDQGGFDFWFNEYANGTWSMPRMSLFFSQSPEFERLYGSLTDAEFIDLIYVNIFGRAADAGGRDYWLGRMANEGLDRGTVMLFFSESPEYIELTQTFTPLAGHFNWYPEGTVWYCGFDNIDAALPAGTTYVDVAFYNDSGSPIVATANLLVDGVWQTWDQATLDPGDWFLFFGQELDGGITGLEMVASGPFIYTMAFSPTPLPTTRVGWELIPI